MNSVLSKIIRFLAEFKKKFSREKNPQKSSLNYNSGISKTHVTYDAELVLTSKLENLKKKVQNEVLALVKENADSFDKLLYYAKEKGTQTFCIKNTEKVLKIINENEGYIPSKSGFCALYLNLICKKEFSFDFAPAFVFEAEKISIYKLLYNFYKWYADKESLPGFDQKTAKKFKRVFEYSSGEKLENLSYDEIMCLKAAIDRDRDAMEFTLNYMKELEASKKAYNKIKENDKGANI